MKVFEKVVQTLPEVKGKVFAITGTTSGCGYIAAKTVAERGGEVLLLNRASARADDAVKKLREEVPSGKFVPITCDLQDFASVRKAAEEIKSGYPKLYCLANNAGITASPDRATKDGYDIQMQTNVLSHFLLTAILYPNLSAAASEYGDARIVHQTSVARTGATKLAKVNLEANGGNLGGDSGTFLFGPMADRYAQSKLANIVFTQALHDKIQAKNTKVRAITSHPGIANTGFFSEDKAKMNFMVKYMVMPILNKFQSQTPEDGATGLLRGMMDPEAESGQFLGPQGNKGMPVVLDHRECELDEENKLLLWTASEAATGMSFEI
mmetsp:Transcript_25956/g.53091  ORF Transcript_25956/g.53091 Transcript_25956/m.53091 type:complete len:324 (-) Transcript_25956:205-1176(-)|eukprot:CAMPEP_0183308260 /NCGR_PEP_ID=MMETSP0160_2-20130417/20807_1 /TAXON_ID=2839 ORGANISM="Odontella Sinensis, Strain Grunow 1884" /NCGR_SAMPLE_ID=MMETSP0160_2 /ASSEMBLY_ACC=CAM_ASM_000250 /LENGTH=323 /DNA_ID=CAMNT_0025472055 /DNA_START=118 /DNA_END=1089 /DNA_ORIENTATION=-